MQKQDFERFEAMMKAMNDAKVMPGGKDLKDLTTVMFAVLEPWPIEAVAEAALEYLRHGERFFPMPSDLVRLLEGNDEDRAALAWSDVMAAVRRWGQSEGMRFPDPAIHWAIQRMGGWARLCATLTEDNERFMGKDFAKLYSMARRKATWENAPQVLQGAFQHVRDTATGKLLPPQEVAALNAKRTQAAQLVAEVARRMSA